MSVKINFKGLTIDQVSGTSGVFSGKNMHVNWESYSKKNETFGSITGQGNEIHQNHNVVFDADYVDVYQPKSK